LAFSASSRPPPASPSTLWAAAPSAHGFCAAWIWALSPFFPLASFLDLGFYRQRLSSFLGLHRYARCRGENTRKLWLSLGALWAVIALTNPALLSVMPFTFLYAAFVNHRSFRPWFASAAFAGVLFAALVSPWLIRNERVFGRPVFFRSNFWFEFHLGNYHFSNGLGFSGKHPGANAAVFKKYAGIGEMGFLDYCKEDGLRFVREHPSEFLDLTLHRLVVLGWWQPWEFWPLSLGGWLGLLFVFTRLPRGWLLFAAALLVYPVPYYFVYPVAKYRHAIEPELLLLSVYFVFVLWSEIRGLAHRKAQLLTR
jgi:hypothetical protein